MKNQKIVQSSFVALFAAIICVGAFFRIPIGSVPIVLQNMLCILTSVIAGGCIGFLPTAIFLFAGLIGLPVYSSGLVGFAAWMGPTGGFFPGYLISALISSLIAGTPSILEQRTSPKNILRVSIAVIVGMVIMYYPGVLHFALWALMNSKVPEGKTVFDWTLATCVFPFILGDVIKTVTAIVVALFMRPVYARYVCSNSNEKRKTVIIEEK